MAIANLKPWNRLTKLVIPFNLLILLVGGGSAYMSYLVGQQAIQELTQRLMREASGRIQANIQAFLEVPHTIITMNTNMWNTSSSEPRDPLDVERQFFRQTRDFQIRGVFFGDEQGRGVAVFRENTGVFQSRVIQNPPKRLFFSLDNQGNRSAPLRETEWDPRQRPWYTRAIQQNRPVWSPVYTFTDGVLGITTSQVFHESKKSPKGVIGVDLDLKFISDFLRTLSISPSGQAFILEPSGAILAVSTDDPLSLPGQNPDELHRVTWETTTNSLIRETVRAARQQFGNRLRITQPQSMAIRINDEVIDIRLTPIRDEDGLDLIVGLAIPEKDFMGNIAANVRFSIQTTLLMLTLSLLLGFMLKRRNKDLADTQTKLENLIQTGLDMGREHDRMALLRKMLFAGRTLLNCDAGTLYLVTNHRTLRFSMRTKDDDLPSFEIPLYDAAGSPNMHFIATYCALNNQPVVVDDIYEETRFNVDGAKKFDAESGYLTRSMLTVPLAPRDNEVIGVLQFINAIDPDTGKITTFRPELQRFVTAMAAQAAVALDNHQLVEAQKELMDALIKLIAGAIDTKSHYTGNHCERVPELAIMLAEEVSQVDQGELADFRLANADQWREFRIAAWLHDCGKVTTPEYVVDKATKLETIYNRIHEVRMRFEVLLRDAMIERLSALTAGEPAQTVNQRFAARQCQLVDDFNFVATCNLGGEFMAPEKIERLQRIATTTWWRHFDDRLGLADDELKRYPKAREALPAMEKLLADKPQHILPRTDNHLFDVKYQFNVQVPEYLYHNGEIYNLSISRGTLNEEERFKVNEHVIQTIVMLEQLPLPKNLQKIPEYAGNHHETLTGSGYPRRLNKDKIGIPSRIIAIADIFEALTASDRPYKKVKTLSESIKILAFFKKDNHIDPEIFNIFLTSGVYKRFAEKYLLPEQIDEVDIEKFL